jgi:type I restriction enzyme, S subunit
LNTPSFKEDHISQIPAIRLMLESADKEIQLPKSKLEKLKEEKKGLIQVLLTGRKRLKIINLN